MALIPSGGVRRVAAALAVVGCALGLTGCGVDAIPALETRARTQWGAAATAYRGRADLIPQLIDAVKAFARQEETALNAVADARARAAQTELDAGQLSDPEALQRFRAAQDALAGALARLLARAENYPDLKANDTFLRLRAELEGADDRIRAARDGYREAADAYNAALAAFPGRWVAAVLHTEARPLAPFPRAESEPAAAD